MKLSIITVNLNNKAGLERTFKSVFSQTYQDFEYIVIDGGSTDGSKELIEANTDKIDYWVSEPDKGIYNAMNKGIKIAKGEYLLFLNSGDYFFDEQRLQKYAPKFEQFDFIYFNTAYLKNNTLQTQTNPNFLDLNFFHKGMINHQNIVHKRSLFKKFGFYDESFKITADWKFLIVAICSYNSTYLHIDDLFTVYDLNGLSDSDKGRALMEKEKNQFFNELFPRQKKILDELESLKELKDYYTHSKRVKVLKRMGVLKNFDFNH